MPAQLTITYAAPSSTCSGGAGHQILQPINIDGSSVFKQGSTVPAKFRVCDASGNSLGTPGVVTSSNHPLELFLNRGIVFVDVLQNAPAATPST